MQSIEQAAKEYVQLKPYSTLETPKLKDEAYDGFKAGIEFAQRWIQFNEKFPPRNVRILMKYKSGVIVAGYFNSTYLQLVKNVESWRPIELK